MSPAKFMAQNSQIFQSFGAARTSERCKTLADRVEASRPCSRSLRRTSSCRSRGERYQADSGSLARRNQPKMPRHTDGMPSMMSSLGGGQMGIVCLRRKLGLMGRKPTIAMHASRGGRPCTRLRMLKGRPPLPQSLHRR